MGSNLPIPEPGLDAWMRGCVCVRTEDGLAVLYSHCPMHGMNAQPERWSMGDGTPGPARPEAAPDGLEPGEVARRLMEYCEQWIPVESQPAMHRLTGWLTGMALRGDSGGPREPISLAATDADFLEAAAVRFDSLDKLAASRFRRLAAALRAELGRAGTSRPAPKNAQHEPPYPGFRTVQMSIRAPYLVTHAATERCAHEAPHNWFVCGEVDAITRQTLNDSDPSPTDEDAWWANMAARARADWARENQGAPDAERRAPAP